MTLLNEGCTIPFISRYRKERTGGLDEVQIAAISEHYERLKEIEKRKETVLKTIREQDKLTPELEKRINDCWDATELEDIYLPFKPRRRTRAQVAREQGLEPLAKILLLQRERDPESAARRFVTSEVSDVTTAIKGAQDIIAEQISEDERSRQQVRGAFRRTAIITSKVVKAKANSMDIRMLCQEAVVIATSAPQSMTVGVKSHSRNYYQVEIAGVRMVLRFGDMEITFRKSHIFSQFHRDDVITDHGGKDDGFLMAPGLDEVKGLHLIRQRCVKHHFFRLKKIGMCRQPLQYFFGLVQ